MQDVSRDLRLLRIFIDNYFPNDKLGNFEYARALVKETIAAVTSDGPNRKQCEALVTELLKFSRGIQLITVQHPELRAEDGYDDELIASLAGIKHVVATMLLHFLIEDLTAIVHDQ
jgi:hypothetical protein